MRTQIAGFDAEIYKDQNYVDFGRGPYVELVPASYGYRMTIQGDVGNEVEFPFDGHLVRWRQVSMNSYGVSEYVGVGYA